MIRSLKDSAIWQKFNHKLKEKIYTYVTLMYDQRSKLNKIQNLQERKQEACVKAKLNFEDADVKDILDLRNEDVNEIIFFYLTDMQNSNRYHLLCSNQQLFWNMQKMLNKPMDPEMDEDTFERKMKLRSNISKEADELMTRIDNLYSEIFATDDVTEMAENKVRKMVSLEQRLKTHPAMTAS